MGGYSVKCSNCSKWFLSSSAYRMHCKATGHPFYRNKIGDCIMPAYPDRNPIYWDKDNHYWINEKKERIYS